MSKGLRTRVFLACLGFGGSGAGMSPVVMLAALRASAINSSPVGLGPEPEATDSEAVEAAEASEAGA